MVFRIKYIKFFLLLLQCCTSMGYGLNVDCHGKAFHCVNTTHFKICVDLGGGVSTTVDDFLLPCPENTFCMATNHYECEYHEITTTATTFVSDFSAVTSDLSKVSVIPLQSTENKSGSTTAAPVQDDDEYKASSLPAADSILEIIEDASNRPAFKSVRDEKLTSASLEPYPTENLDKSFDFNDENDQFENNTNNFDVINTTEYSSVINEVPSYISIKNETFNDSTKNNSAESTVNVNSTKYMDQETVLNVTKTIEKNGKNMTSDEIENILQTNNYTINIKINNVTSETDMKNKALNMSTNFRQGIHVNKVTETPSLDSTLFIRQYAPVEKSTNQLIKEPNTSSEVNIVLNKSSDTGVEKNIAPISNSISNNSETLDQRTVTVHKADVKRNIINVHMTMTPTHYEKNNSQAFTGININDVKLLQNIKNASTYPSIVMDGNNLSLDKENQTVSNSSVTQKLLKGLDVEEESNISAAKISKLVEDDNSYLSLSHNSTESPEVILTSVDVAEFEDEMKVETNTVSNFNNVNISSTDIANATFTTKKSRFVNQDNNMITYPDDNVTFLEVSYMNNTTQQPEIMTAHNQSENLNENNNNNTPSFLDLQTTTEYNEVVKINTKKLNVENFTDVLYKTLIDTDTIEYNHKNESNYNVINFKGKEIENNLKIFPASMSVSKFVNNRTTSENNIFVIENDTVNVITSTTSSIEYSSSLHTTENKNIVADSKVAFMTNKKNSTNDDIVTSTTSSTSYSDSLHTTTSTDSVVNLKEGLIPNKKNSTSFILTFLSTTKNYDADASYTSSVDYENTNIINISYSSFKDTTTESYEDAKTNDNFFHHPDLQAETITSNSDVLYIDEESKNAKDSEFVKKDTTNTTSSGIYITIADSGQDNKADSNINITTSSADSTSSFLTAITDYEIISSTRDNITNFENKIKKTNITNNYSTEEYSTMNASNISNIPNKTPKDNNSQERFSTVPSLLETTLIDLYEIGIIGQDNNADLNINFQNKIEQVNATKDYSTTNASKISSIKNKMPVGYNLQERFSIGTVPSVLENPLKELYEVGDNKKDNNEDSNVNITATTHYGAISKTMTNLHMTNFENEVKQPNVTDTSSTIEHFITNASKMNEIHSEMAIANNLQKHPSTETVPRVAESMLEEIHETATNMGQTYFKENDGKSNRVSSSFRIDDEINNGTSSVNNFQKNISNIFNLTLVHFNETPVEKEQDEVDEQKVVMNSSEVKKNSLYPIYLPSKTNMQEVQEDKFEVKEGKLKSASLDSTTEQKEVQNAGHNNISQEPNIATSTSSKVTEEYKSTEPLVLKTIIHNEGPTIINISNANNITTDSSKQFESILMDTSTTWESQLNQKINTTEPLHNKPTITVIETETLNLTDSANPQGMKQNVSVKNFTLLETDFPLKIHAIIPSQNENYNASALFGHPMSTTKMPPKLNTLVPLLENNIISKVTTNVTSPNSIIKLSSFSITSKHNNLTTNLKQGEVTDFYAEASDTDSDVKSQTNAQNEYTVSSGATLLNDTKLDTNTTLKLTTPHKYTSIANSPELQFRKINKTRESTLNNTNTENKNSLKHKLSGVAFNVQPRTTQTIEINTRNTVSNYLPTEVPAAHFILKDKSQNNSVHDPTEKNLLNLSDTVAIREKQTSNSSTAVDSKRYSFIINMSEPITDAKNEMNQLKESKTNASVLIPNTFQNKSHNVTGILDMASITNLEKPRNLKSSITLKEFNLDSPTLATVKTTTVKATINDSNSNNSHVKNVSGSILETKSLYSIQSSNYNRGKNVTNVPLSNNSKKGDVIKANICLNQPKGKYADKHDCKKFYLCLGDATPVLGECPNGTVYSESKKQCTKNLSQCYRNNQFTCLAPGRYYDLRIKNIYYICVKNRGKFIKFKYQCENGYSLNETIVKCIKDFDSSLQNNSDSSSTKEDSTSVSVESSSKTTESLNIKRSKEENEFECKKAGKYPHPKKCHQYYVCTKIKKSVFHRKLKTCESGEFFDKEKKQCVDTDSHEC